MRSIRHTLFVLVAAIFTLGSGGAEVRAEWVDTGENAVLFKYNDDALNFAVDHIQTQLNADYGDVMTVNADNPLTLNEILYDNETYINLLDLDTDKDAYTSPLYFKCPALDVNALNVWEISTDESGKRDTSDAAYNPMECRYVLKLTDKKKTKNADGTKSKKDRTLYFGFALEDLEWDVDASALNFRLVNSQTRVDEMIAAAAAAGTAPLDDMCSLDSASDGVLSTLLSDLDDECDDAVSGFLTPMTDFSSSFTAYDEDKHQFTQLDGLMDLGAGANVVFRISCDKNEGSGCPEWFSDFGSITETSDEKIFEVKAPFGLQSFRPEVWSQMTVEGGTLSLDALFLNDFKIQGLTLSTSDLTTAVLDAANVVVDNSRIWGVGFLVRWIFRAALDVAEFLSDFLTNYIDQHLKDVLPFLTKFANQFLSIQINDFFVTDLNAMQTAPIVGTASITVDQIKNHTTHTSSVSAASTNAISATLSAAPASLSCLGGTRPALVAPSGRIETSASYHVALGLAKQTVQMTADATVEAVDWCQDVDFDTEVPCTGGLCPPSGMGGPSTIQLTETLTTILYPEFDWYEAGINRTAWASTLSPSSVSPVSSGIPSFGSVASSIGSALENAGEIATLTFAGIDESQKAIQGHVVFKTNTGLPLYEADFTGNVTAFMKLTQDCSGDYWFEADRFVWSDELAFSNAVALDPSSQAYMESQITVLLAKTKTTIEAYVKSNSRLKVPVDYTDTEAGVCAIIGDIGLNGDYGILPLTLAEDCPEIDDPLCPDGGEGEPETPIDTPVDTPTIDIDIPVSTGGDVHTTVTPGL